MSFGNSNREPVSIDVRVVAVSRAAIMVVATGCLFEADAVWIPHSQILDGSEIYDGSEVGNEGNLVIPTWLAEDRGLS